MATKKELSEEVAVEYEVTVRVTGARLPDVLDSYCVISLTHPSLAAEGQRMETFSRTTEIAKNTDAPSWTEAADSECQHVSELPHTALEVSLWGKKNGRDEPYGSYKIALKPSHFDESKQMVGTFVPLEGTHYNIEHPDDLAARRALELNPNDEAARKHVQVKFMPQIQLEYFCRVVPLAGQCDHCRAVMRHPLADLHPDDPNFRPDEETDARRPFTLPCSHTVCGQHLIGTGQCPCCNLKVIEVHKYLNYLTDKYLEFRLMENSKTCAQCGGPRARIYCPSCNHFFCAKCDTAIHDRNLFFRQHVREDARKPYKVLRAFIHHCDRDGHDMQPFTEYDTNAATDKAMCPQCVQEREHEILHQQSLKEGSIKDYVLYRKELMDKIKLHVEALQKVTDKQLALYQATILRTETDIEARTHQISDLIEHYRSELPKALRARETELHSELESLVAQHNAMLEKQAQMWVAVVLSLQNQERMTEYIMGPIPSDDKRLNDRASKVDLMQLYQIREGLQAVINQKFFHHTYVNGHVNLSVDSSSYKTLTTLGQFTDVHENDGFRGNTSVIKCDPKSEKFVQLSRSIMGGDLPYFFAVRLGPSAADGAFAQVGAIGVTKYGTTPSKSLTDRSQLANAWVFSARQEIAHDNTFRYTWKFHHDKGYVDVEFKDVELVARRLGQPDSEEIKEDASQPNSTFDLVGCLVDRQRAVIELFKYLPHAEVNDNPSSNYYVSTTVCQIEDASHFFPTVSVVEGTEKGLVEIACSRFVANRDQAIQIWRELFA